MHTALRRTCAAVTARASPSLSRSFSPTARPSASLSDRLRQRRAGPSSSVETALDSSSSSVPTPEASTSSATRGNLPSQLDALTQRAIDADPIEEQRLRKDRQREQHRVAKLSSHRRDHAKQAIELKKRAKQSDAERDIRDGTPVPRQDGDEEKPKDEPSSLAKDLRRRMGFSNPGRTKRDQKRSLRLARLAAGGDLTQGEKQKLAGLQAHLKLCKKRRQKLVPWNKLSKSQQKQEYRRVGRRFERERQLEQSRKDRIAELEQIVVSEPDPSASSPSSSSPPLPSASRDDILPSVSSTHEPLPIIHHGSRSPYSAPTAPSPVIPSSVDLAETTPGFRTKAERRMQSEAAMAEWASRRVAIDREIEDVENLIAGYLPPGSAPVKGPEVPKPQQRSSPSLLTRFVGQLKISEEKGKEKEVGQSQMEEAEKPLLDNVDESNEQKRLEEGAEETEPSEPHGHRRGRITPRKEREERLRIARSRPYRDHPALQPGSSSTLSTSAAPAAANYDSTRPPRALSSYPHLLSPSSVSFSPTPSPLPPVPIAQLSHSLSRTLFNPGVHFLRDPRTGVYNFNPEVLENVPRLDEFEFEKLPQYVTSSKDEVLKEVAKREGKTFSGSTSSTVGMLCQIYFWLSKGKQVNTSMLSEPWSEKDRTFSMGQQLPVSVILHRDPSSTEGTYSIDADKSFDATSESNILAHYGHLMEKLLTTDPKEFKRFLVGAEDPAPSEADHRQAYHYAITDRMVLRSQLDAVHEFLPGNGTFDLKTRGTVAIRQDRLNYEESAGYTIDRLRGPWESFEREYYDLIRSAFLKYQFQARIGCMDGIFVAYHSTARFYGFQYLAISEMDEALFDTHETGKQVFRLAVGLLERLLDEAAKCFEGESVNVTWANDARSDTLRLFVTPHGRVRTSDGEGQDDADAPVPMTLLEVKGTNYVDGEVSHEPVVIRPTTENGGQVPVWQVGYEVEKSTGDLDGGGGRSGSYDSRQIADLFSGVRETQKMFSSLMLPTGVSPKEHKLAAERAKASGVELDSSDLSVRFPVYEGVTYRGPSHQAKDLRKMSREGKERTKKEEEERRGGKRVVVKSIFEVIE